MILLKDRQRERQTALRHEQQLMWGRAISEAARFCCSVLESFVSRSREEWCIACCLQLFIHLVTLYKSLSSKSLYKAWIQVQRWASIIHASEWCLWFQSLFTNYTQESLHLPLNQNASLMRSTAAANKHSSLTSSVWAQREGQYWWPDATWGWDRCRIS